MLEPGESATYSPTISTWKINLKMSQVSIQLVALKYGKQRRKKGLRCRREIGKKEETFRREIWNKDGDKGEGRDTGDMEED